MSDLKKIQLDPPFLDEKEAEIIDALERGEFKSVEDLEKSKREFQEASKNTAKTQPITIRLPIRDIQYLRRIAKRDGVKYQTLVSSVLHQFTEGRLKRTN